MKQPANNKNINKNIIEAQNWIFSLFCAQEELSYYLGTKEEHIKQIHTLIHRQVSARKQHPPTFGNHCSTSPEMTVLLLLHKFTSDSLKVNFSQKAASATVSDTFFLSVLILFHFAKILFI